MAGRANICYFIGSRYLNYSHIRSIITLIHICIRNYFEVFHSIRKTIYLLSMKNNHFYLNSWISRPQVRPIISKIGSGPTLRMLLLQDGVGIALITMLIVSSIFDSVILMMLTGMINYQELYFDFYISLWFYYYPNNTYTENINVWITILIKHSSKYINILFFIDRYFNGFHSGHSSQLFSSKRFMAKILFWCFMFFIIWLENITCFIASYIH